MSINTIVDNDQSNLASEAAVSGSSLNQNQEAGKLRMEKSGIADGISVAAYGLALLCESVLASIFQAYQESTPSKPFVCISIIDICKRAGIYHENELGRNGPTVREILYKLSTEQRVEQVGITGWALTKTELEARIQAQETSKDA